MLMVSQLSGFGTKPVKRVTVSTPTFGFGWSGASTSSLTTYTFSSVSFTAVDSAATGASLSIVGVGASARSISSVTVTGAGGSPSYTVNTIVTRGSSPAPAGIYTIDGMSSGSYDITVTFSSGMVGCAFAGNSIGNLQDITTAVQTQTVAATDPASTTLDITSEGGCVLGLAWNLATAATVHNWTMTPPSGQPAFGNDDGDFALGSRKFSTFSGESDMDNEGSYTLEVDWTGGTPTNHVMLAAFFI